MSSHTANQRDFYRVDCPVVISYCLVGDHAPVGKPAESFFPDNEHFNLLRELRRLDQDNSHLLHTLGEQDRGLGAYLGHINRKLDLLARHIASLTPELGRGSEQTISLSEGGLSFSCATPPAMGSVLAIRMTLLPAYVGIAVYASVVKLMAERNGNTHVSVNYERLQDADRQIIARHVMQVQMAEQRKKGGRE
ncbi:MAG: PilZ domain-containing protein [Pseudomonadales bacterium]|nr:PilZ domain-containing protein [Pseudomonadales bacterium]